jgi:phosphoserine phosphatase
MSQPASLVTTLICNPANPVLTPELAHKACEAADTQALYWLADGIACDLPLKTGADAAQVAENIRVALGDAPVDVVIQEQDSRRKKLLIADMDSTMIQQECIDELAEEVGLREHIAGITARAMNGEIAFEPALRERVALLKGLPVSIVDQVIANRITLTPGGRELIATMKKNGAYTALVSGGFTSFTSRIAAMLGITAQQAMAVGDGANDLPMIKHAGSGIALHAKPAVAAQARIRIDHGDLTALLYIQGYRKTDFVK